VPLAQVRAAADVAIERTGAGSALGRTVWTLHGRPFGDRCRVEVTDELSEAHQSCCSR
jgi:hypothetical protein